VTSFDHQQISVYFGTDGFQLEGGGGWRFEVVGETSILNLFVFPEQMNVHLEAFDRRGGQPLVSLWLDYCESIEVRHHAGHPTLTINQSVYCEECSARRERHFFVVVQPKLRIWNEG
jgi:hypothetical protein